MMKQYPVGAKLGLRVSAIALLSSCATAASTIPGPCGEPRAASTQAPEKVPIGVGTIAGVVLSEWAEPRVVRLMPGERVVQPQVDGRFTFDHLEPGVYTVEVRTIGYQPDSDTVTLHAHSGVFLRFELAKRVHVNCAPSP